MACFIDFILNECIFAQTHYNIQTLPFSILFLPIRSIRSQMKI